MKPTPLQRAERVHEDLPKAVDWFLQKRGVSWKAVETGDAWNSDQLPFPSLDRLIEYLIYSDPVFFVETLFCEKDGEGIEPWRLWEYQRLSMRIPGHTVHECGAEVGKSREIAGLAVWMMTTGRGQGMRGDVLISAALDGHLDPLYEDIKWQLESNRWLSDKVNWGESRVKPYKKLRWKNGNNLHFRQAGHDGRALRSLHINLGIFGDEWAKVPTAEAHGNLISRAKPPCWLRLYSTPDDRRDTPFATLCRRTTSIDPLVGPSASRRWDQAVRIPWPKPLMPPPYWTADREAFYVEQYSGRETNAYQQNVMGRQGDPTEGVFPWPVVRRVIRYLPEFLSLRLVMDQETQQISAETNRLSRGYRVDARAGDEDFGGREVEPPLTSGGRETFESGSWDPEATIRANLPKYPGHLVCGIDVGGSLNEPTEIWIGKILGSSVHWVARVSLVAFEYPPQAKLIRAIDRWLEPTHGWGIDATGVGLTLGQLLTDHDQGEPLDLAQYVLNRKVPDLDLQTGEPRLDSHDNPILVPLLELSTRMLELRIQKGETVLPYDPDLMLEFQGLTAKETSFGFRKFRGRDHIITALRTGLLRLADMGQGTSSPPMEVHIPENAGRSLSSRLDF